MIVFSPEDESKDSIQLDLQSDVYTQNAGKTIYVFHAPPNNTGLDVLGDDTHKGSFAVREFIEKAKPYLTLHGHIHETVERSKGKFKNEIGDSVMMSASNHNQDNHLSAIVFDAYNLQSAQRVKIPCGGLSKFFSKFKR